jgi:hypothetical protein
MPGSDGFEGMLATVAIEKQLGIDDIARFTPAPSIG